MKELPTKEELIAKEWRATESDDLQFEVTLNPDLSKIYKVMEEYAALRAMPLVEALKTIQDVYLPEIEKLYEEEGSIPREIKQIISKALSSYTGGADPQPAITLEDVRIEEAAFSDQAFGKDRSFTGPLNHLKKEIQEVIDANTEPYDPVNGSLIEFADCLLLLLDAFRRRHKELTAHDLLRTCMNKIAINKKRKWGKPDENGVVEHIRDEAGGADKKEEANGR